MNIFVLNQCAKVAAQQHCDKHCVKQILETAQMMACAVIRHGATPEQMPLTSKGTPYKGGYKFHPCSVWSGDSNANFVWLAQLGLYLCAEYTYRYGKTHACEDKIKQMADLNYLIPDGERTPFAVAISEDKRCRENISNFDKLPVDKQYQEYYCYDKSSFAKWTRRKQPEWYQAK